MCGGWRLGGGFVAGFCGAHSGDDQPQPATIKQTKKKKTIVKIVCGKKKKKWGVRPTAPFLKLGRIFFFENPPTHLVYTRLRFRTACVVLWRGGAGLLYYFLEAPRLLWPPSLGLRGVTQRKRGGFHYFLDRGDAGAFATPMANVFQRDLGTAEPARTSLARWREGVVWDPAAIVGFLSFFR